MAQRPNPPLSNIPIVARLGWPVVKSALDADGQKTTTRQQGKWEERGLSRDAIRVVSALANKRRIRFTPDDFEATPPHVPTPRTATPADAA